MSKKIKVINLKFTQLDTTTTTIKKMSVKGIYPLFFVFQKNSQTKENERKRKGENNTDNKSSKNKKAKIKIILG